MDIIKYYLIAHRWVHPEKNFSEKVNFLLNKDTKLLLFIEESYTIKIDIIKYYSITHK